MPATALRLPKYNISIHPVREVTLIGAADLDFWRERLAPERLRPLEVDGRAQIVLVAVDSQFMGLKFRELPIAVSVVREPGHGGLGDSPGIYLPQAFNSRRCFAWVERTLNASPYHQAAIEVHAAAPASFAATIGSETLIRAAMGGADRRPLRSSDDTWEGPFHLPGRKLFYARLHGESEIFAYSAADDRIEIRPAPQFPILQMLLDSGFAGREWHVRTNGTHSKSKTVRRPGG